MENAIDLKLKDTGSLTNWMLAGGTTGHPIVGEGATEFLWTDRHAFTVTEVSADGKSCVIVEDKATPNFEGMTDSQSYTYEPGTGTGEKLTFKWGAWRRDKGEGYEKRYPKISIKFGVRDKYYDFSF